MLKKFNFKRIYVNQIRGFIRNSKGLIINKKNIQFREFSININLGDEKIKEIKEDDIIEEEEEKIKENDEKLRTEGLITETEILKGEREVSGFQAETKQLLNIVATALYTDKEVFSNININNFHSS
jgi:hypothetical protein